MRARDSLSFVGFQASSFRLKLTLIGILAFFAASDGIVGGEASSCADLFL
jgi:hypothetical protein